MTSAVFHDYPGLEYGHPKFHDFPGPVVILYNCKQFPVMKRQPVSLKSPPTNTTTTTTTDRASTYNVRM